VQRKLIERVQQKQTKTRVTRTLYDRLANVINSQVSKMLAYNL